MHQRWALRDRQRLSRASDPRACVGPQEFPVDRIVRAGQRLAAAYTLAQSCRTLDISTRDYLLEMIEKIEKIAGGWPPRRLAELMPQRWKALRPVR
ncbi:MAG: transposase domain-containing protein [Deltaproteobacteria bacterium]|nr:transposase domain-containing protein [Nannocystaceae bacterium]